MACIDTSKASGLKTRPYVRVNLSYMTRAAAETCVAPTALERLYFHVPSVYTLG